MSEKQLEKLYYSIYPMQAMFEDYKEYTLNLKQTEQRDAYIDGLAFGIRTISEAFLHENKNRIWWLKKQSVKAAFSVPLT